MEKCIVGAVASVLPAFPRILALPEHMLFSQTEAQFFFHYLCSPSARLFIKYATLPDAMVTLTYIVARGWRHCRCGIWSLRAQFLPLMFVSLSRVPQLFASTSRVSALFNAFGPWKVTQTVFSYWVATFALPF